MRREILFEKFEKPTFVNEDGVMYWENKSGILHRGYYRPAILDVKFHTAWFIVNGKVVRVENTNSIDEQIQEIIEEFDFDKVWNAMRLLNWTWHGEIPTINQIKQSARRYLNLVCQDFYNSNEQSELFYGSGGLEASCDNYGMRLKFVLTEWDTKVDDEYSQY